MDLQIEELLAKYWKGETSIAEEELITKYFEQNPDLSMEGEYFRKIALDKSKMPVRGFKHPGRKRKLAWLSVAAAVTIGLLSLPIVLQQETTQDPFAVDDPKEALEITRASLMMVSKSLNRGKTYSNELNKFNEAKKLIKQ